MSLKRTASIFVVCAVVVAWFSAAMTPNGPTSPVVLTPTSPIDVSGAELAAEIGRLHERLRPDATPRRRVRNAFAFASASRAAAAPKKGEAPVAVAPPVVATAPVLTLAGVAEDAGADGPVRTAVLSGSGQLFLVKEGETLHVNDATYRVSAISESTVDLVDIGNGSTRRLTLR